jgi:flagellin
MPLNVISNFAANVAHRNLVKNDMEATQSLAKLSSGTRVVSARDDAASLAIGSRLAAEVKSMTQANVNAGQAISMLQIADGAMARVSDILVRMKVLAVQASSGQLSNTERSMLDTEYQQLLQEAERIAQDTEFNGNQLVNGASATNTVLNSQTAAVNRLEAADGFASIVFDPAVGDAAFTVSYDSATNVLTVRNLTTGQSEGIDIGNAAIPNNQTQVVRFAQVGVTITLNSAFNKGTDILPTGTVTASNNGGKGSIEAATINLLAADVAAAVQNLSTRSIAFDASTAATAAATIGAFTANNIDLSTVGTKTITLSDGTSDFQVSFVVTEGYTDGADITVDIDQLGALVFGNAASSSTTDFTFKVGTGTAAQDQVSVSVDSVNVAALGLTGTVISGADATNADNASTLLSAAIDSLNSARANVGAAQNRIDFAAANVATAIENAESARSALLDLDVAQEISTFTSKQILLQAGVSMLAQANQLPQSLLRLFQ